MEDDWYMQEEISVNFDTDGVKFILRKGDERKLFEISRIALVDYFQTADTRADALQNFEVNRDRILALALRILIEKTDSDTYNIHLEDCRRFQL